MTNRFFLFFFLAQERNKSKSCNTKIHIDTHKTFQAHKASVDFLFRQTRSIIRECVLLTPVEKSRGILWRRRFYYLIRSASQKLLNLQIIGNEGTSSPSACIKPRFVQPKEKEVRKGSEKNESATTVKWREKKNLQNNKAEGEKKRKNGCCTRCEYVKSIRDKSGIDKKVTALRTYPKKELGRIKIEGIIKRAGGEEGGRV